MDTRLVKNHFPLTQKTFRGERKVLQIENIFKIGISSIILNLSADYIFLLANSSILFSSTPFNGCTHIISYMKEKCHLWRHISELVGTAGVSRHCPIYDYIQSESENATSSVPLSKTWTIRKLGKYLSKPFLKTFFYSSKFYSEIILVEICKICHQVGTASRALYFWNPTSLAYSMKEYQFIPLHLSHHFHLQNMYSWATRKPEGEKS